MRIRFLPLLALPLLTACGDENVDPPVTEPTLEEKAAAAKALFHEAFLSGNYDRVGEAQAALKAVYDEDPNIGEGETAMLLGATSLWSAAEWRRNPARGNDALLQEVVQGDEVLKVSIKTRTNDGRAFMFAGVARSLRAQLERSQTLNQESSALFEQGISLYPEFSLVGIAFAGASAPINSPPFAAAVKSTWDNINLCVGGELNRDNPDFSPFMHLYKERPTRPQLACWGSPEVAPHNLEGFFVLMGDLLVKNNQPQQAIRIYNNAKLLPRYGEWRYQGVLADRIDSAVRNAALYRDSNPANDPPTLASASYQCAICHQK
jgi:hypothetical protein